MKAISVRQPFAYALLRCGKDVENRSTPVLGAHRGDVAVQAGTRPAPELAFGQVERITGKPLPILGAPRAGQAYRMGAIVGVVAVTDAHREDDCRMSCSPWALSARDLCDDCRHGRCSTQHAPAVHYEVARPRPLRLAIDHPGRLGLFALPDHISARVAGELGIQEDT